MKGSEVAASKVLERCPVRLKRFDFDFGENMARRYPLDETISIMGFDELSFYPLSLSLFLFSQVTTVDREWKQEMSLTI